MRKSNVELSSKKVEITEVRSPRGSLVEVVCGHNAVSLLVACLYLHGECLYEHEYEYDPN